MTVLIADKTWHGSGISGSGSPTLNYSVSYEAYRPTATSDIVLVKFTITMRSLYSDCWFDYPLYCKTSLNQTEHTITSRFGSGVKSVSYTTDWIQFSNTGTSLVVGFTPRCGDLSHTGYDEGTIYFNAMEEEKEEKVTIINVSDFNLGDSLAVTYTNPNNLTIKISVYDTTGGIPYAPYRECTGSSYTFNFTDDELDKIYKAMGENNSITVSVYLATDIDGTTYRDYKNVMVTLTGNKKTGHTNINGSWKRAKRWVNVNDTWKRCVRWVNVNGTWRRCI